MSELLENILNQPEMIARFPSQERSAVALSFKIKADSRRVLYALSIPEYMEAWLRAPDREELLFVSDLAEQDNFRLYLYRARALQTTIHGSSRVLNTNQINYVWKTKSPVGTTRTLVDIRIAGSARGCTLHLKHSGLHNMAERVWHRRMWCQSMERLSLLIGTNR